MRGNRYHNEMWSDALHCRLTYHEYVDEKGWVWTLVQVMPMPDANIRKGWYACGPENLLVRDDDPNGGGYSWNRVEGRFMAERKSKAQALMDTWVKLLDSKQYIQRKSATDLSEGRCA